MKNKKFYITTPLYRADSGPHIGHAYTVLAADVLARHLRAWDIPVHFQAGTDERGPGTERDARQRGAEPGAWGDAVSAEFRSLWRTLNVRYDGFLRSSDPAHEAAVQAVFAALLGTGDVYPGLREGPFCSLCGAFYSEDELRDGKCPAHGRPVERGREDAYFFRLSRYRTRLLEHYATNPDFLSPRGRGRELIDSVRAGLDDIPVSSSGTGGGTPLAAAPGHTLGSRFGALLAYATGAGYSPGGSATDFPQLWPPDVHLAGKESFRSHGVVWPAVLMALGLELPRRIYAHGWWTVNGCRMSGTHGNFIKAEDVVRDYGVDALRYFLFREAPFGEDADFSSEALRRRYNADLADGLDALFSRITGMTEKYLEHRMPRKPESSSVFAELSARTPGIRHSIEELRFSEALETIWQAIGLLGRHADAKRPWTLEKKDPAALRAFLNEMVWSLRLIAGWLDPFMPDTASKMHLQLGVGRSLDGTTPQKLPPLFPRKPGDTPKDLRTN